MNRYLSKEVFVLNAASGGEYNQIRLKSLIESQPERSITWKTVD